jgi:hypothetical protein
MHPALGEIQPFALKGGDELLRLVLHTLLWRDIDRKPRLSLVVLLVHKPLHSFIESQEHYLRDIQA